MPVNTMENSFRWIHICLCAISHVRVPCHPDFLTFSESLEKMVVLAATLLFSCLVSGSALSLLSATHLEQQPDQSTNEYLQILNSFNTSGDPTNATASQGLKAPFTPVHCDSRLGHDLQESSCLDALRHRNDSRIQQTWGPRGMGFSRSLPQMTISSKCHQIRSYSHRNLEDS